MASRDNLDDKPHTAGESVQLCNPERSQVTLLYVHMCRLSVYYYYYLITCDTVPGQQASISMSGGADTIAIVE